MSSAAMIIVSSLPRGQGRRVWDAELGGDGGREETMIIAALLMTLQVAVQAPRLERLDPETRGRVGAVIDSARAVGLPSESLVQRALEGVTKGAAGARMASRVQRRRVAHGHG